MNQFPEGSPFKRSSTWSRIGEETEFAKWIKKSNKTFVQIARMIGASERSVKYWAQGQSMPTLLWAFAIEKISKGKVPVASWLGTKLAQAKWNQVRPEDGSK